MRKILARTDVAGRITEPADELDEGPVNVRVQPLDDGNVSFEVTDESGGLVVFEAKRDDLLVAFFS